MKAHDPIEEDEEPVNDAEESTETPDSPEVAGENLVIEKAQERSALAVPAIPEKH